VLVVLTRDHNQVKALQEQLETLPSRATGGSLTQMSRRKSIVDMITVKLSQHEAVEEEYFWPAVRESLPDGDRWADEAIEQEQQGKDTLTTLGKVAVLKTVGAAAAAVDKVRDTVGDRPARRRGRPKKSS
jgi:hypothetical protein